MPRDVWKLGKERSEDSKEAYLIVDDSVHDKRYSRFIELVRRQYSGNEHRVIKGIGVVSLVHSAGKEGDFYPIDYRGYAPDVEGKTKNDHFQEMCVNAVDQKQLQGCCQLIHIGTIAGSHTERVTTCFPHAARGRIVISRQLRNLFCIS